MKIQHLVLLLSIATTSITHAAIDVFNGYQITYYSTYGAEALMTPAELAIYQSQFPDGTWSAFNQTFIDDYISLSALYGGDAVVEGSRIFAWWDNYPNTRLRAAVNFGYDIAPIALNDGRYAMLAHVSQNWLDAIAASSSLQQTYQYERKTEEYVQENRGAVPEPSSLFLLLIGIGILVYKRRKGLTGRCS